jgi:hypothetical protein
MVSLRAESNRNGVWCGPGRADGVCDSAEIGMRGTSWARLGGFELMSDYLLGKRAEMYIFLCLDGPG